MPPAWMPACRMDRIITHWTAGSYHASDSDREHYHFLIEGDGHLLLGEHAITDNLSTGDGDYAAHTRGLNTRSIGVAVCCMAGAEGPRPFRPGLLAMTERQWEIMAAACADLSERYQIPATRATLLGHGEVEGALHIRQHGKWDPMVLPWEPARSPDAVGETFRVLVRSHLAGGTGPATGFVSVAVEVAGKRLDPGGYLEGDRAWIPLRPACQAVRAVVAALSEEAATVVFLGGRVSILGTQQRADRRYCLARDFALALGTVPVWRADDRMVSIREVA